MKLEKVLFSDLSETEQESVIAKTARNLGENCADHLRIVAAEQKAHFSGVIDAEIVRPELGGPILDYRVFDPYNFIEDIYSSPEWSDWWCGFQDNQGNDLDTIFDEFDGETQD